jgi:serine/threonine protein kinase
MNPAAGLPVEVSSAKSMPPEEVLFRDGLGDRVVVRDAEGRPSQESLVLRTELSAVPSFEFALNERLWLVERFDHPTFLIVRNVVRLPGRLPRISLISDYTGGTRLSDVLARAEANGQLISAGAAVFVIKEILEGLAELHRQSGDLSHGALAPERIVLAEGRVRIADYVLGAAIEQLRFSAERYWKELRVAVPASAGSARLDRRVDVAQVGMIATALLASRPLRDSEHMTGVDSLLASSSVALPIRSWLLKALHMDMRRVFVNATEALQGLEEAIAESGLRLTPRDLDLHSMKPARAPRHDSGQAVSPAMSAPAPPIPPKPVVTVAKPAVTSKPPITTRPAAPATPRHDVWQARDTDADVYIPRAPLYEYSEVRKPLRPGFKRFLWLAILAVTMTAAFTAAQFIPAPDWLFSRTGTLVIESNPQGVEVLVNGKPQGVTPLTLKVEVGRHEVELRGSGKPKIFNVYVSRGDRVAQYVEFPQARPRR